jgi:hypothetical protein
MESYYNIINLIFIVNLNENVCFIEMMINNNKYMYNIIHIKN